MPTPSQSNDPMDQGNTPIVRDSIDPKKLQAMRFVAAMRESADRIGAGFIGGFIAPDGEMFTMSNMDPNDIDVDAFVRQKLNDQNHDL